MLNTVNIMGGDVAELVAHWPMEPKIKGSNPRADRNFSENM
jgi:hypothetical protein